MIGDRQSLSPVRLATAALLMLWASATLAGPFAPPAGQPGSEAISKDDPLLIDWATGVAELVRGPMDIAAPAGGNASFGTAADALGPAEGTSTDVVSLGDGGHITLFFTRGIRNGIGFDFAVFENGFADTFLELAFVEVSTNGVDFFRFDSVSLTQTTTQVGAFDPLDTTDIDNLAGKYRQGFGTPFDLQELSGVSPALDISDVGWVRLVDVVGSISPALARFDSLGNMINDPYPTAFSSGGFDLDAVGVIHRVVPEPGTALDIKPGSDPNSINLGSNGVLPVAILTTDDFDALDVDVGTILFGDPVLLDDGGIGVAPLRSGEEDVNGDGLTDLTLKFKIPDLIDNGALGDMSVEAILTGGLLDGTPIQGSDSVRLVPPGDANNDQIVNAADYTIWADGFGTPGGGLENGDFNEDDHVDAADYTMWADNFGTDLSVPGSAAAAVPEPSTFVLSALGLIGLVAYGWRRRRGA